MPLLPWDLNAAFVLKTTSVQMVLLRRIFSWYLTGEIQHKRRSSLLPSMCKAQKGLFLFFFFLHNYIQMQEFINVLFWICDMVKHMCYGCWNEQQGFGRPSVWNSLLICTILLCESTILLIVRFWLWTNCLTVLSGIIPGSTSHVIILSNELEFLNLQLRLR